MPGCATSQPPAAPATRTRRCPGALPGVRVRARVASRRRRVVQGGRCGSFGHGSGRAPFRAGNATSRPPRTMAARLVTTPRAAGGATPAFAEGGSGDVSKTERAGRFARILTTEPLGWYRGRAWVHSLTQCGTHAGAAVHSDVAFPLQAAPAHSPHQRAEAAGRVSKGAPLALLASSRRWSRAELSLLALSPLSCSCLA